MSKTDKKVISIFLVLIMFIAQLSPVFAVDYVEQETTKTLTQYLIENGVDANEDGVLSDAEWGTVKNLNLDGDKVDVSGIEKAVNLKSLEIVAINPNNIDFSKLTNLKSLYIKMYRLPLDTKIDLVFPKMNSLEDLDIEAYLGYSSVEGKQCFGINCLDISKLENLKHIQLYDTYNCEIQFPTLEKIQTMDVEMKNDTILDLTNSNELSYCSIYTDIEISSDNLQNYSNILMPNLKYGKQHVSFIKWQGTKNYIVDLLKIEENIFTFKLGNQFTYFGYEDYNPNNIEIATDSILSKTEHDGIIASRVGTETIKVYDDFGNERNIKVTVDNNVYDTTLEYTGVTAEFIDYDTILKSNGELWKINSETTAEKIDTNVKDYVSRIVYTNDMNNGFLIENTLKKDNKLIVKYNDVEKEIANVTSMTPSMYVNTDGELYELNINYITEEMKPTKILEGAKRVYMLHDETKYIEMNTGTTYEVLDEWRNNTANNDYENIEQIPEIGKTNKYWSGIYLKLKCNCLGQDCNEYNIACFYERIDHENVYKEAILDSVNYINHSSKFECDILLREDGSIWTYSEQYGLTKITKSTPSKEEEKPPVIEGDEYIKNPTIKDKEVGGSTAISGIGGNKTVESLINGNNFNEEYTIKVFDSNNQEVASTKVLGTGLKVKLYKDNNEVQEYVILIYGDISGDGTINAFDALTLIKGINNKVPFKGEIYKEAGRIITGSGQAPTALDALAIVKSANNKYTINQSK